MVRYTYDTEVFFVKTDLLIQRVNVKMDESFSLSVENKKNDLLLLNKGLTPLKTYGLR